MTWRQTTGLTLIASSAAILAACGGSASAPPAASQTITFTQPADTTVGATPLSLVASATSGLTVTFSSTTSGICTVSGTTLTAVSAGTCTVQANQAGNGAYAAAPVVSRSLTVGPAAPAVVTFSTGFGASATVQGGGYGGYAGSDLDGWYCNPANPANCGSFAGTTPGTAAADSYFGFYYQTTTPATVGEYVGVYVQAPGVTGISTTADTAGVTLTNQTSIRFKFNQNPEWFNGTTNKFGVLLTLGKFYNTGGPCNIKLLAVVTPTSVASTTYTVPLSSFSVVQNCGVGSLTTAAALALSPISQIDFQGDSGASAMTSNGQTTGANTSVVDANNVYPTTLVLVGGITFQ